jgi:hypothetical protein
MGSPHQAPRLPHAPRRQAAGGDVVELLVVEMTMIEARPTKHALVIQVVALSAFVGLGLWICYKTLVAGNIDDSDLSASQTVMFRTPLGIALGLAGAVIGILFFGSHLISTINLYVMKRLPRIKISDRGLWCHRCSSGAPIPWEHVENGIVVIQRGRKVWPRTSQSIADRIFGTAVFRATITNPELYLRKSRLAKDRIAISLDGLDVPPDIILAELRRHIAIATS